MPGWPDPGEGEGRPSGMPSPELAAGGEGVAGIGGEVGVGLEVAVRAPVAGPTGVDEDGFSVEVAAGEDFGAEGPGLGASGVDDGDGKMGEAVEGEVGEVEGSAIAVERGTTGTPSC